MKIRREKFILLECGSPNMLGIHALSASLSLLLETGISVVESLIIEKTKYLMDRIDRHEQLILLSQQRNQLNSGIIIFKHKTIQNNVFYRYLQENGVVCALRSGGIRLSPHFYNNELKKALSIIELYCD